MPQPNIILVPGFIYELSGKLLLLNTPAPPMLNYFHEMVAKVYSEVNHLGEEVSKTFTSGIGLVVSLVKPPEIQDEDHQSSKKPDFMILVNHSDWDPTVEIDS
jgi:hypothetical protein